MPDLTVCEMLEMQRALQEKYRDQWEAIGPAAAQNKLLWMLGECGEVIDILKKQGGAAVAVPGAVREHFIEEMADVLMYFHDLMLCYDITPEDMANTYREKFERNMKRW